MRALWIMIALTGCRQLVGLDDPLEGDGGTPPDDATACWAYATTNFDSCTVGIPEMALDLTEQDNENGYEFDTGNGRWSFKESSITGPSGTMVSQTGGPDVRIVNVTSFNLGSVADLRIRGPVPLILVVHGNATIDGHIQAESGRGNDSVCDNADSGEDAEVAGNGGGGGGGGGFGVNGAIGGAGGGTVSGGGFGMASGDDTASPLRGGCDGGTGGRHGGGGAGGSRGVGGGALQISVRDQLTVGGQIESPGQGGSGGALNAVAGGGGGGGGAGGTIFLEALNVSIASGGRVCAHGGGGGEGGSTTMSGENGNDGSCFATGASGGSNIPDGGNGGTGGAGSTPPTGGVTGGVATAGGGGGGGAVGRIRIHGVATRMLDGTVTPAPSQ